LPGAAGDQLNTSVQILILSDLHANLYALQAVLADAEGQYEQIVCCGDVVGYNPHPVPVLEWTQANCPRVIRGNHDKVVAGIDDPEWFNEVAKQAAIWTIGEVGPDQTAYLRNLEKGPVQLEHFHIWHGSARDEDEYVTGKSAAAPGFLSFVLPLAFFGHTHLQGGFFSKYGRIGTIPPVRRQEHEAVVALEPDVLYMINSGSVGQPRDGDPRAAYAIYDVEQKIVKLRRVGYPVENTAADILKAGLPSVLALRLSRGL
jgi:predicted phosphodiesterase